MIPPKSEDFQKQIDEIFAFAERKRLNAVTIISGDLHRVVGGYPGNNHRMPICCSVMKKNLILDDQILNSPPSGMGATLQIQFRFPRAK